MTREELEACVYVSIGEASMCWDLTPHGIFDSERAIEVGDRLLLAIDRYIKTNCPAQ